MKKRYFYFAATYYSFPTGIHDADFNYIKENGEFPSKEDLKDIVRQFYPNAQNIVILSVCELSKADFEKFIGRITE